MPSQGLRLRRLTRPTLRRSGSSDNTAGQTTRADVEAVLTISETAWRVTALAILVVAAGLRLYMLELSPFHNDEGVNGWFLTNLMRHGTYVYDPANYHGPTLYYLALVSSIVVGLNDVAVRLVPASAGLITIGLALAMRRWIGTAGSLAAAALLAVSPGWLYFSRYFIHEELLVCFTVALVYFGRRWAEERRTWQIGAAAWSAALLFATKETAILTAGVLLIALACLPLYERIRGRPVVLAQAAGGRRSKGKPQRSLDERVFAALAEPGVGRDLAVAAATFAVVYVLFYSSFLSNLNGISASFGALAIWTTTGTEDHLHSIVTYAEWLLREELPITLLAVLGGLIAVWAGRSRFAVFLSLWAFGLFAAYSLIGYKTPWLLLNFLVPMALIGGWGVEELWERWRGSRIAILGGCVVLLGISGFQAVQLSFADYDNDSNPYVYAHTVRDIDRLISDVDTAGARLGTGVDTHVVIMSPDYWPLPWYWRNHPGVGFFGQVIGTAEPIVIVRIDQEATLAPDFLAAYARQAEYTLRPGVQLALYFRRDAFGL